jgi:hypothetical protein
MGSYVIILGGLCKWLKQRFPSMFRRVRDSRAVVLRSQRARRANGHRHAVHTSIAELLYRAKE